MSHWQPTPSEQEEGYDQRAATSGTPIVSNVILGLLAAALVVAYIAGSIVL